MAWNESGGGDKDPWGNRGNNNDGPPDLDEAIRKLQGLSLIHISEPTRPY